MGRVNGNIQGIKDTLLERIELLYDMRQGQDEFVSREMVAELSQLTGILGREISVYIGRDGRIADVSVGDNAKVSMPNMRLVRNEDRLCGVRCIHTHPNGDGRLSGVDLGTLRSMRLDSMAAIGVREEGEPTSVYAAYLGEADEAGERGVLIYGPMRPYKLPQRLLMKEIYLADDRLKSTTVEADNCSAVSSRTDRGRDGSKLRLRTSFTMSAAPCASPLRSRHSAFIIRVSPRRNTTQS